MATLYDVSSQNIKCAKCETIIDKLPFIPRDVNNVFCKECNWKRKNKSNDRKSENNNGGEEKHAGRQQGNFNGKFYPNGYYKDGKIDEDLFDKKAEDIVSNCFAGRIRFTKIRQYYDEVNHLYCSAKHSSEDKETKENIEIKMKLLIAKAIFDSRRNSLVPESFVSFLKENEELVRNEKGDFLKKMEIFKKHFEVIIAYGKKYLKQQ